MTMIYKPMLAESIEVDLLAELSQNDDYYFEQKLDGDRILLLCENGDLSALQRYGDLSKHNDDFQTSKWNGLAIASLVNRVILDGEYIDGILYLFDMPLLEAIGDDIPGVDHHDGYDFRRAILSVAVHEDRIFGQPAPIQLVPCARTSHAKALLAARCIKNKAEGVMVKHKDGEYEYGRRSKGCLKAKFVKDADVIIKEKNVKGKDNALLEVFDDNGKLVPVGSCSLIGKPAVDVGDVVVVKYLYLGANGKLVQPSLQYKRTDKKPQDCLFAQLIPTNKEVLF